MKLDEPELNLNTMPHHLIIHETSPKLQVLVALSVALNNN